MTLIWQKDVAFCDGQCPAPRIQALPPKKAQGQQPSAVGRGLVFLVLYLSICMSLTRPIHCQSNPNGLQTMVSSPAVLCWAPGPHVAMAVLSLGGPLRFWRAETIA